MAEDNAEGATLNERLLYAARNDDTEILSEIFETAEKERKRRIFNFNIDFQDGIGNTALHYAALHGSLDVLNELLEYGEGCDVDPTNIQDETPLHLAVKHEEPELRAFMVDSLLDAGADTSIKDKDRQVALDYVPEDDKETRNAFRRYDAIRSISAADIVPDDDDEEDDYSESDEE